MKKTRFVLFALAALTIFGMSALAAEAETVITLSDGGVTVDGQAASANTSGKVHTGAAILYYESGRGSSYGEGTAADEHDASEAAAHTVVTITRPGTYRISGSLSKGQLAVDLGSGAANDPNAVVTLILDGVDITCTVAPALIFYNVYECGAADAETAAAVADTTGAGANVVIADGSVNNIDGSYVARIHQEGTTKKLHKYDGAFYAKMSMNVSGEAKGTGVLNITAANEGMDSERHLTIHGGVINIRAQNDGINTNEDGVSVTTINGGTLTIDGGFGDEGDGIDSNGYLVINGGEVYATAHTRAGDGGIDADMDILINGGTVIASGTRNDATGLDSKQAYLELSFASTQKAGTVIRIEDAKGGELLSYAPARDFQSLTVSLPALALDTAYHVYANGVQQQYTGTGSFGYGRMFINMAPPEGVEWREGAEPPDRTQPPVLSDSMEPPEDGAMLVWREGEEVRIWREGEEMPEGMTPPGGFDPNRQRPGDMGSGSTEVGEGSVDFVPTAASHSFSGVSDSADTSGKTAVSFRINEGSGVLSVKPGETPALTSVTAQSKTGAAVSVPAGDIQLTITDVPSENYAESCMLSDSAAGMAAILPEEEGLYALTVSVVSGNARYAGTTQVSFVIGDVPFADVQGNARSYEAIQYVYDAGLMQGTGGNRFSPSESVSRAMAITVLGRLAGAEPVEAEAFQDVEPGSWYAPYVGWAARNDLVGGYGDGRFGPEDVVTREQMCVILYQYAKAYGLSLSAGSLDYRDAAQISDGAEEAVAACAASGLLDGILTGDALNPAAALTRAELAELMMSFAALL